MGDRIRSFDWSQTPLGSMVDWPQSLITTVRLLLRSRYPMFLWWGPEKINLYNDAYIPILGSRHPQSLGMAAGEIWEEIWTVIGPQSELVLREGQSTWNESVLLIMERHGYIEETYFTFSYSPATNDAGEIAGVFCACTEDTQRVIGERQLALLRELAASTADARTWQEVCICSADALASNSHDLTFAMLYMAEADGSAFGLAGVSGIEPGHPAAPTLLERDVAGVWSLARALESREVVIVDDLPALFDTALPTGAWSVPPKRAALVPIAATGQTGRGGVLVTGLNPLRVFDDGYRNFLTLVAGQISASIASAQAYEEEKRRAEALAELDQAKTDFFSNVSHEFRTPLTLMLGPVETLLEMGEAQVSPMAKDQLRVVQRNSLRLLKLVNTMLDFSRIEAGRIQASYQPVDLATTTAELASVFRAAIERAGLRLLVHCPPLPEHVYVDNEMWEKIVLNLLSNAFKFTLEGEIEVRLELVDGQAQLTVRDTGVGIPDAEMPRIFERFHRVKEWRGRSYEGTGIGLALVQELVKLHGGTVRAESKLNEGTRFIVNLPLGKAHLDPRRIEANSERVPTRTNPEAFLQETLHWLPEMEARLESEYLEPDTPAPSHRMAHGAPVQSQLRIGHARIVLADDNADMREYVSRLLGEWFTVEACADGQEALDAIRAHPPDLVLSDMMMPRLDGLGVLAALRNDPFLRDIPIILLSARAGEEARIGGIEAGADDYLIKPFSARELLVRVESQIRLARQRKEADEALRLSEQRLAAMLQQLPVAVGVIDQEGQVTLANSLWRKYVPDRLPARDPSRSHRWRAYTEDGAPIPAAEWSGEQALRGTFVTGIDFLHTLDDESEIWLRMSATPFRIQGGKIIGAICVIEDIDAQKRSEQALRESEARYRAIVEGQVEMVCRFRPDGTILFVNGAYARARGTTPQELMGSNFWDFVEDEDVPYVREMLNQLRPDAPEVRIENRFETAEGIRWTLWTNHGLTFDDAGRALEVQSSGIDITARKRAEQALRESEERFRTFADTAPAMLWTTEPDTYCTFLSRGWYEYTGQTPEEALGLGWLNAVHPDDRARSAHLFQAASEKREALTFDFRLRRIDGEYRWAIGAGRPRFGSDGEFLGFIGSVIDVHERKRAEEELRRLNETLEERVQDRTQQVRELLARLTMAEQAERRHLSQILHDDLQQLLYGVEMKLVMVRQDLEQTASDSLLDAVDEGCAWIGQAITKTRQLTVDLSPPILKHEGLADALQWLPRQMKDLHGLQVSIEAEHSFYLPDEDLRVLLFQIVRELLFNVKKHAGVDQATVQLVEGPETFEIQVIDHGRGFDMDKIAERAEQSEGFGLLSIRERLRFLGGKMVISSRPGRGTRVSVFVPVRREEHA